MKQNVLFREAIKEDEDGLVEGAIADIILKAKRKRQAQKKGHSRLGMMRHFYIIVDCSESMSMPDLKPTRIMCTTKVVFNALESIMCRASTKKFDFLFSYSKSSSKSSSIRIPSVNWV